MKIKTHWKAQTQLELCRQSVSPIANIREMRSLGFNFHWALFLLFSLLYSIVSTYRLRSFTFSSYLFCIYATFGHITLRRFKWGGGGIKWLFLFTLCWRNNSIRGLSANVNVIFSTFRYPFAPKCNGKPLKPMIEIEFDRGLWKVTHSAYRVKLMKIASIKPCDSDHKLLRNQIKFNNLLFSSMEMRFASKH